MSTLSPTPAPSRPTAPAEMAARVRAVILNYNGGSMVAEAVRALLASDWPEGRLEVVVVDNASTDGSQDALRADFPSITVIDNPTNEGFPGNNTALADLDGVDYVLLNNSDAFAQPSMVAELVEVLDQDRSVGAACPKIVFAPRFLDLVIESDTFVAGGGDTRRLGVQLSAIELADSESADPESADWTDGWRQCQLADGCWGLEHGPPSLGHFTWTSDRSVVRAPTDPGQRLRVRLSAPAWRKVSLDGGGGRKRVDVGPEPAWFEVVMQGEPFDVINNVGSIITVNGSGADRGYLEPDRGQFDQACDVFAWCGAGVMMRREYLETVGLFDQRFFMYYEDVDLAWRGQAQGWRYRYVPDAVLRHIHAATSVEGSNLFAHFVERNRLAYLTKNAPARFALATVGHYVLTTLSYARRDLVGPLLRRRRPRPTIIVRRIRSLVDYLGMAPSLIRTRHQLRRLQVVDDATLAHQQKLTAWAHQDLVTERGRS